MGEVFAAHFSSLMDLHCQNKGKAGIDWQEAVWALLKETLDEVDKVLHYRDIGMECIFDMDRPMEEWTMLSDPLDLLNRTMEERENDRPAD
jgi:hypothetical protein